ncbi:MAG TPA: hypothetical protein VIT23_12455, partial [Terrimicrobiaceae bacterium]
LSRSLEKGLRERAEFYLRTFASDMGNYLINSALERLAGLVTEANQFIERNVPWKLAKEAGNEAQLDHIFYHLAEVIRLIAIMISPVMPRAALGILKQLNWDGPLALKEAVWGQLPEGHQIGTPTPIFPRLEISLEA